MGWLVGGCRALGVGAVSAGAPPRPPTPSRYGRFHSPGGRQTPRQMTTAPLTSVHRYDRRKKPLLQRMDLNNPKCHKLLCMNPKKYKPQPELAKLYQELDEAEKALKGDTY